jgi:flagellar biosynthesis/type III secretory pathway chaperone
MSTPEAEDQPIDLASPFILSRMQEVTRQVEEFTRLLEDESRMMKARSAEELQTLVAHKNQVLDELLQYESFLIMLFTEQADRPEVKLLKQQLQACREINLANQSVVMIELNAARKSLELLRTLLKMDDLPLYGAAGQVSIAREKRNLGSA